MIGGHTRVSALNAAVESDASGFVGGIVKGIADNASEICDRLVGMIVRHAQIHEEIASYRGSV